MFTLGSGVGLFVGLEMVTDKEQRTPATDAAAQVVRRYGVRLVIHCCEAL